MAAEPANAGLAFHPLGAHRTCFIGFPFETLALQLILFRHPLEAMLFLYGFSRGFSSKFHGFLAIACGSHRREDPNDDPEPKRDRE
jgi:hypothetical protein